MDVSCAFATSLSTPDHIALADRLGYARAWCYDSPPLYPDVWMTLALAAQRTTGIGLGPGVLIPHLRHVMTNAAAIATLEAHAPGRVSVAIGSGFTGRLALGQRPQSWKSVRAYILALRALLRGDEVEWDGAMIKMLHRDGFGAPRPLNIPIIVAASGPRGFAVAAEVGDGVIRTTTMPAEGDPGFKRVLQMTNGTILEPGEAPDSPRVMAATGHGAALAYHSAYEMGQVDRLPGGADYARQIDALPERSRHLAVHDGHLVTMNDIDRQIVTPEFLARLGRAADADTWRGRLDSMEREGVTEVVYQAAGPDIPRELTAFADMAGLTPRA
jgi:5,10-methylenetetrahydromethanopterin reductase